MLKTWVRGGGTLVTMGGATEWAADENVALTSARKVADAEPKPEAPAAATPAVSSTAAAPAKPAPPASPPAGSIAADRLAEELVPFQSSSASANTPESVPGIHVDALLDRTHWLTAGYDAPRLTVLLQGDLFLAVQGGRERRRLSCHRPAGARGFHLAQQHRAPPRGTSSDRRADRQRSRRPFTNEPMFRGWWRSLIG